MFDSIRRRLGRVRADLANFGQQWPISRHCRPMFGQDCPSAGRFLPNLAEFGQICSEGAQAKDHEAWIWTRIGATCSVRCPLRVSIIERKGSSTQDTQPPASHMLGEKSLSLWVASSDRWVWARGLALGGAELGGKTRMSSLPARSTSPGHGGVGRVLLDATEPDAADMHRQGRPARDGNIPLRGAESPAGGHRLSSKAGTCKADSNHTLRHRPSRHRVCDSGLVIA